MPSAARGSMNWIIRNRVAAASTGYVANPNTLILVHHKRHKQSPQKGTNHKHILCACLWQVILQPSSVQPCVSFGADSVDVKQFFRHCTRLRFIFGSSISFSISTRARSKSRSSKSSIRIPACDWSTRLSESPIPALMTIGSPHARYSPFFVGDEANLEKQRLMKATPTSPAARYEGISLVATARIEKRSSLIPRAVISCRTRSWLPFVSQSTCASALLRTTRAKKSAICSVKYQPSREPL